jgi:cytochrome c
MRLLASVTALTVLLTATPAAIGSGIDADAALRLHNSSGCLACHAVDSPLVGPSYKAIAQRYEANEETLGKLVEKVRLGGAGAFGQIPMPPHAHISEENVKTIVEWILSLE